VEAMEKGQKSMCAQGEETGVEFAISSVYTTFRCCKKLVRSDN
jgi:hypothetical protein